MPARTPRRGQAEVTLARRTAVAIGVFIALVGTVLTPGIARAHTGFESSTPAEGSTVEQPVDVVTVVFTGEATPVGDEFIALTPDGVVQSAASIETTDNMVFTIRFDPPLTGGEIGIRWNVQAADAHPIEGAFAFTVNAPASTTAAPTTIAPTTVVPTTAAPTSSVAPAAAPVADDDAGDTGLAADLDEVLAQRDQIEVPPLDPRVRETLSLDEFLTIDDSRPGDTTATVGRLVGLLGVALGLGALAFVATALRGRRQEIRQALAGVRALGIVITLGAAIEYVGVARIGNESLAAGWSTAPGFATVLRLVGGLGLVAGLAGAISRGDGQRRAKRPPVARSLSAAVTGSPARSATRTGDGEPIVRWTPDARSWPALAGVVLIIVSFWFDGHTVNKGIRPLHALVNSVHVAAGAVWVGGVVTMAAVIWARHRSGRPMRTAELVVRFSKIATIALAAVVVAGAVMAYLVLDSFGDLTGTTWGQILLLKTAAVGLAMIGGAYNHFRLLPAIEADPESPELVAELRSTVTAEAIMLVFVVCVTAWLVTAAS